MLSHGLSGYARKAVAGSGSRRSSPPRGPLAGCRPLPPAPRDLRCLPSRPRLAGEHLEPRFRASSWRPLRRGLATTPRLRTTTYSLVGATWRGGGSRADQVRVRSRTDGQRGDWRHLRVLTDLPDAGAEGVPGRRGTEPLWVGPAEGRAGARPPRATPAQAGADRPGQRAGGPVRLASASPAARPCCGRGPRAPGRPARPARPLGLGRRRVVAHHEPHYIRRVRRSTCTTR